MTDADVEMADQEPSLAPLSYFEQINLAELRRYVCLDMARLAGAMPDKMIRIAHDKERFLIGGSLHAAEYRN